MPVSLATLTDIFGLPPAPGIFSGGLPEHGMDLSLFSPMGIEMFSEPTDLPPDPLTLFCPEGTRLYRLQEGGVLKVLALEGKLRRRSWYWTCDAQVNIVDYETWREDLKAKIADPTTFDLVILDEIQCIKNRGTDTHRSADRLDAPRRWGLTGPPIEYRTIWLDLTPVQAMAYAAAERAAVTSLAQAGYSAAPMLALALLTKLKQICNLDTQTGASCKFDFLSKELEGLKNQNCEALILSQYPEKTLRPLLPRLEP